MKSHTVSDQQSTWSPTVLAEKKGIRNRAPIPGIAFIFRQTEVQGLFEPVALSRSIMNLSDPI